MTAHQLLKITIDQLRPGMHIGNVFNERGTLLYSANTLIQTADQIESLRRQGVTSITIDLKKGSGSDLSVEKSSSEDAELPQHSAENASLDLYTRESVWNANTIRQNAADAIKDVMKSVLSGRMFSIRSIADRVEEITESMTADSDLMLNLCRLYAHSTDIYTHSVNVSVLMIGCASALNYSREKVLAAGIGGLLHDIGVTALPQDLFGRQGNCTRQEMELFKKHPALGLEIFSRQAKTYPEGVPEIIAQHHERLNGEGYPMQLTGDRIRDLATLCAIADTYDTLTSRGSFGKIFQPQEALALIFQGAEEEYSRTIVEHFTKLLGIYPVGSFVKLDTGEMGVVVRNNRRKLLSPMVRILFGSDGKRLAASYIRDLAIHEPRFDDQMAKILHSLDPTSYKIEVEYHIFRAS